MLKTKYTHKFSLSYMFLKLYRNKNENQKDSISFHQSYIVKHYWHFHAYIFLENDKDDDGNGDDNDGWFLLTAYNVTGSVLNVHMD